MTGSPLLLPVFPSKNLRAWPKHPEGGAAGYQLAAIALGARYATDAHTAGYSAPSVPRRLDRGAAEQIPGGVAMVALFVDVDGAEHKADPTWRTAESSKITAALAALPGGLCYQTRGGYRLVWRLAAPVLIAGPDDAARWRLRYWRTLLALSRRFGLEGDPACADWTRLYRLPHATRDEGGQPEALPTEGDPELRQPLAFEPDPADLAADLAEARRLEAAHPATRDERGKTTTAAPWGAAVKALALEAGEGEPEGATSLPLEEARPVDGPAAEAPPRTSGPRPSSKASSGARAPRLTREDRERMWAEKARERMASDLAATTRGGRNNAARDAALVLGHYAPHLLNPSDIERALLAACERNGLVRDDGRDAALTTIRSAISDGMKTPKRPNVSDDQAPAQGPRQTAPSQAPIPTEHDEAAPFLPLATPRDLPAFPLHALPGPVAAFAAQISVALECPLDLPACLALGALGSVSMKRFVASPRVDWQEPLNLYVAVALEPGESKSPAFRQIFGPLYALQKQQGDDWKEECKRIDERNNNRSKGEPEEPKPARPRLFVDDATPEKIGMIMAEQGERITLASDEGTAFQHMCGLYSKNGQANAGVYLKAHDGGHYVVDRTVRDSIHLEAPLMAVALAVQPTVIRELAKRPDLRGRGLWGRFVYAFPASRVGTRTHEGPPVDPATRDEWRALLMRLASPPLPKEPEVLRLSLEAHRRFHQTEVEIERAMLPGGALSSVRDWAGKLRGLIARLAGLLHMAEDPAPGLTAISVATVERSIDLARYFTAHALYTFNIEMTLDPAEQAARQAWEVIQRKGLDRVTPGRLAGWVKPLRKTADATAALEHLRERGYLRRDPEYRGQGKVYLVCPRLLPSAPVCPPSDPVSKGKTSDNSPCLTVSSDPEFREASPPYETPSGSDGSDGSDGPINPQDIDSERSDRGQTEGQTGGQTEGSDGGQMAPLPDPPSITPPPVSCISSSPANTADPPPVDLAAGDEEGWESLE